MKKIINIAMLLVLLVSASSCLKSGLDDLPTYDEAKITISILNTVGMTTVQNNCGFKL